MGDLTAIYRLKAGVFEIDISFPLFTRHCLGQ